MILQQLLAPASLLEQLPICGVLWQDFLMILMKLSGMLDLR